MFQDRDRARIEKAKKRTVDPRPVDFEKHPVWAEVGGKLTDTRQGEFKPYELFGPRSHLSDLIRTDSYKWAEPVDNEHTFKFAPKF